MKTSWLCATLLPLFLFSCALSENQWKDNIPEFQRVKVHSNAYVPCPRFTASEITFRLYKGKDEVVTVTYGNSTQLKKTQLTHAVNASDNTTHFVLNNVSIHDTGLYTCTAEKNYPPPLVIVLEEPQTILIVENSTNTQQRPKHCANHLPLWVGIGVLSVYGLIITVIVIIQWWHLKKEDNATPDYMNVKPRIRRKKQAIHHPTHQSWYNDTPNGKEVSKKLPSKGTAV